MSPKNLLEIPEVMDRIASYLEREDLTSCICVSTSWRDMFLPHRWGEIEVGFKHDMREDDPKRHRWLGPRRNDIYRRRHLIHSLTLIGELFGLGTFLYPNLLSLKLNFNNNFSIQDLTVSVNLAETCPLLTHLELYKYNVASVTWMALSVHPHIKSLSLKSIQVANTDAPLFWKACRKLEILEMLGVTLEEGIPEGVAFDRLRKLEMLLTYGLDEAAQMDLILQSTMLETLRWQTNEREELGTEELIRRPIQSDHWPNLHRLCINHDLRDTDVASILTGVGDGQGSITECELDRCELGTEAFGILHAHFNTLVMVDVSKRGWIARSTVPEILCNCPHLKIMRAKNVFAKDIANYGPWVCQQLQELMICFRVGESREDLPLQQLIFQRLSTLTRLEKLIMRMPLSRDVEDGVLQFRLDCGLEQLTRLQELTSVTFSPRSFGCADYIPQLGMEEVAWMASNWKKLRRINGRLNGSIPVEIQLKRTVRSLGIQYFHIDISLW